MASAYYYVNGRSSSSTCQAMPLALAIGQCGGQVSLFKAALQDGSIVAVADPADPSKTLYKWRVYSEVRSTENSRVLSHEKSLKAEGCKDTDVQ